MSEAADGMNPLMRGFPDWQREIIRDALYEDLCLYDGWIAKNDADDGDAEDIAYWMEEDDN